MGRNRLLTDDDIDAAIEYAWDMGAIMFAANGQNTNGGDLKLIIRPNIGSCSCWSG